MPLLTHPGVILLFHTILIFPGFISTSSPEDSIHNQSTEVFLSLNNKNESVPPEITYMGILSAGHANYNSFSYFAQSRFFPGFITTTSQSTQSIINHRGSPWDKIKIIKNAPPEITYMGVLSTGHVQIKNTYFIFHRYFISEDSVHN